MGGGSVDLRTGCIQRVTEGVASNSDEACLSGRRDLNAEKVCEPPNPGSQKTGTTAQNWEVQRSTPGSWLPKAQLDEVTSDPSPTTLLRASSQYMYGLLAVGLLGTTSVHKLTTLTGNTLLAAPIMNLCREHCGSKLCLSPSLPPTWIWTRLER